MSMRGLVVALLCGLIGLGGGVLVAYAVEPRPAHGTLASPVPGVSPSVPGHVSTASPYATDITYPTLSPELALPPPDHTIHNHLATWTYHAPQGWQAYNALTNALLGPNQINRVTYVRYKPADEPDVGGYSLYVKTLDNVLDNVGQEVATKRTGFQQAGYADVHVLKKTGSALYFTYREPSTNYLRYNFFQWFAANGQQNATLQVSVAGRKRDAPGLRAMLHRFADNLTGVVTPRHPPSTQPSSPATSGSTSSPTATP